MLVWILGWFLFCSYFTLVATLIGDYDRGEWPYLIPFLLLGPVYFLPAWFIIRPILQKVRKY